MQRLEKECSYLETLRCGFDAFKSKIGVIKLENEWNSFDYKTKILFHVDVYSSENRVAR